MVLKISTEHASVTIVPVVTWDLSAGKFVTRQRIGNEWLDVAVVQPFAIDVWLATHGWEQFVAAQDGKPGRRDVKTTSVSDDLPARPGDGWKPFYAAPCNSSEIGGRELIIRGQEVTAEFVRLMHDCAATFGDTDEVVIPVVSVATRETEFGLAPSMTVINFMPRPDHWRRPTVSFR